MEITVLLVREGLGRYELLRVWNRLGCLSVRLYFMRYGGVRRRLVHQAAVVLNATGASKGGGSTRGESGAQAEEAVAEVQTSPSTWRPPSEAEDPPVPTS